jgi:hypothetical protein
MPKLIVSPEEPAVVYNDGRIITSLDEGYDEAVFDAENWNYGRLVFNKYDLALIDPTVIANEV